MANLIEVINLGLSQIKVAPIESLTEQSAQAIHVNRIFEIARDAALADVAPKWARRTKALALTTEVVSGFDFAYAYPAECLKDIEIFNPNKINEADTLEYEVGIDSTGNGKLILTNYEEAELIYVAKITNTSVYDLLFVEALAWKIAGLSVMPLKGDQKLALATGRAYTIAVGNAQAITRNQGYKNPDNSNSFTRARR